MTPHMEVEVLEIAGVKPALLGLGLSYGKIDHIREATEMVGVAKKLIGKGEGHDKYLESIIMWLDVKAPRYWWAEADTYRISSKQSQSTMHTIHKGVTPNDFEGVRFDHAERINSLVQAGMDLMEVKGALPESFLQRREWCLSLKTFVDIRRQRRSHRLPHWRIFTDTIDQVLLQQHLVYQIWEHFITKEDKA